MLSGLFACLLSHTGTQFAAVDTAKTKDDIFRKTGKGRQMERDVQISVLDILEAERPTEPAKTNLFSFGVPASSQGQLLQRVPLGPSPFISDSHPDDHCKLDCHFAEVG